MSIAIIVDTNSYSSIGRQISRDTNFTDQNTSMSAVISTVSDIATSPFTRDVLACGSSGLAIASGLTATTTVVGSPMGVALLISGTMGLSTCIVSMTLHGISAATGKSYASIGKPLVYTSPSGSIFALSAIASGQSEHIEAFAEFGNSIGLLSSGFVGIGSASNVFQFAMSTYDLASGGSSIFNDLGGFSSVTLFNNNYSDYSNNFTLIDNTAFDFGSDSFQDSGGDFWDRDFNDHYDDGSLGAFDHGDYGHGDYGYGGDYNLNTNW